MTSIMEVTKVSSEVMPGRGFIIETMKIGPGEMVAIVMNDRRLRSDLIDLLDGSMKLESGSIEYFDKNGKSSSLRLASVTHDRNYLGDIAVSEYLDHFRDLAGLSENKIKKEEILSSLHLSSVADCKAISLPSQGQVFVELARALYSEPDILLIDMATFPPGLDTDKTFAELLMKWSCSGRSACMVLSNLPIVSNPLFERVFHHQFGRIVEDKDRKRTISTLDWYRYNIGVDDVGEAIKILDLMDKVNVIGSVRGVVQVSVDEGIEISDVNKELVSNGLGVVSINPASSILGGLIP